MVIALFRCVQYTMITGWVHSRMIRNRMNLGSMGALSACFLQDPIHGLNSAVDIGLVGLPVAHRDAHAAFGTPSGAAEEGFTRLENLGNDGIGAPVVIGVCLASSDR